MDDNVSDLFVFVTYILFILQKIINIIYSDGMYFLLTPYL